MHERPDAIELVETVRRFLLDELRPAVDDPRLRFRVAIAANALGIAARETRAESQGTRVSLRDALTPDDATPHVGVRTSRELAEAFRAGERWPGLREALLDYLEAELRLTNPAHSTRSPEPDP